MDKGFAYLVAVMDLYSRKVLSWRLFDYHNQKRKHQTLKMVPDETYAIVQELKLAA